MKPLSRFELVQLALPYLAGHIVPALLVIGAYLGGAYVYLPLFFGYGIIALADLIVGTRPSRPNPDHVQQLSNAQAFRWATFSFVPIVAAVTLFATYQATHQNWQWWEYVGLILSTSMLTGGIGITVAHELVHRKSRFEVFLAEFILLFSVYMHFTIEHIGGHHRRIATPEDNVSAPFGESVYHFLPRAIIGSFISACMLENKRLAKLDKSPWNIRNRIIWYVLIPFALMTTLFLLWGAAAVVFFALQAFFGLLYLEVVNYVEHYGLRRNKNADGKYERVSNWHSWNSDHVVSNFFLFKLPTHPDHHMHAHKRFQILETPLACPQLPFGYPTMIPIAFVTPLWRYIMDPLVKKAWAHQTQQHEAIKELSYDLTV